MNSDEVLFQTDIRVYMLKCKSRSFWKSFWNYIKNIVEYDSYRGIKTELNSGLVAVYICL